MGLTIPIQGEDSSDQYILQVPTMNDLNVG